MIHEKLHSYNVYRGGSVLVGTADDIELPGFEYLSETISGHGIMGEIEDPTIGLTGPIELELKFRTLYEDISLNPKKSQTYTIRGTQQGRDLEGNIRFSGIKAVVKGRPKGFEGGTLKKGSPIEPSVKLELTYYKLEVNGEELFEIDKLNGIFRVDGEDIMADINKYL